MHVNVIDGDDYHTASVPVPDRIAGSRSRPKGQAGGGVTAGTITLFVGRCFGLDLPAQACPTFPHPPAPPMGGDAGSEFLELSTAVFICLGKTKNQNVCLWE